MTKKVVVLGAGGGIGSVAVRALTALGEFEHVVAADVRLEAAREVAGAVPGGRVQAARVDASDPASLLEVLRGANVVLNCIGPFYRFGPPILDAAIEARVPYVDVCDDLGPTVTMLGRDGAARDAGIPALVGMGNSPGLANVFARLCADTFFEQVESVDIMHIHGGEPQEGPAVIKHRIHAMTTDIPVYLDGKFTTVRHMEPSGQDMVVETEFRGIGTHPVYPYPHPETVTLPEHIPGLRRATNMGVVFPLSYFRLTQDMVRVGACTEEPLSVQGQPVVPLEFSVAHILARRPTLLREAGITEAGGCLKVEVAGQREGEHRRMVLSLSSSSAGAGEGTGIPAAVGAVLLHRGAVTRTGVFPPEAGMPPVAVLELALEAAHLLGVGGGGDAVHVEEIDARGNRTEVPLQS
ncbi:MAG: saccharopine dehydrogenase family protein [Myxococcota bacterium]